MSFCLKKLFYLHLLELYLSFVLFMLELGWELLGAE